MDPNHSRRRRQSVPGRTPNVQRHGKQDTVAPSPLSSAFSQLQRRRIFWLLAVLLGGILIIVVVIDVGETTTKTATTLKPKKNHLTKGSTDSHSQQPNKVLPAPEKRSSVQFFSRARNDRAGAALLDMLLCHAFAWREQVRYGGSCIVQHSNISSTTINSTHFQQQQQQEQLIQWMGLQDELPFACPTDRFGILLNRHDYFAHDTKVFTQAWLDHIQSVAGPTLLLHHYNRRQYPVPVTTTQNTLQVAVHVRRGDVTPCTEPERYLANSYYLALLDRYLPTDNQVAVNVTIYSDADADSSSLEDWKDFTDRGYTLALQTTDLRHVWQAFITADMLVMSKSSFSLVPALFKNRNQAVVYTPFWHKPLAHWTVVPQSLVDAHVSKDSVGANC